MTALGLGGLGRPPITVSVFPDFHPAQVAWGVGTILRLCPTEGRRSPSRPSGSRWCPFDGLAS